MFEIVVLSAGEITRQILKLLSRITQYLMKEQPFMVPPVRETSGEGVKGLIIRRKTNMRIWSRLQISSG
jgi:hypothetical protein